MTSTIAHHYMAKQGEAHSVGQLKPLIINAHPIGIKDGTRYLHRQGQIRLPFNSHFPHIPNSRECTPASHGQQCACSKCNHTCNPTSSHTNPLLAKFRASSGRRPYIHDKNTCTDCCDDDAEDFVCSPSSSHLPCSICNQAIYTKLFGCIQTNCCGKIAHPECVLAELEKRARHGRSKLWDACWCGKVYGANGELINDCVICGLVTDIIKPLAAAL